MKDLDLSIVIVIGIDTRDVFYNLHGRPPNNVHIAKIDTTGNKGFSLSERNIMGSFRIKKVSKHLTSVARPDTYVEGNSFACVSQVITLGPWVMPS